MHTLKLTTVGSSTGAVFPKELLASLKLEKGDSLYAIETKDGILLTPYDPEFEEMMGTARKVMKKRRNVLRELAK